MPMIVDLPSGLYRVTTHYLCAGFVVRHGKVVACAPILRRSLRDWLWQAERVGDADN